ncbi:2'-5' RNA ligase family protein [Mycolicibacterium stellerae]|uniref:2'-5' RNA ligase family protein n=1 Tax=Mycolicibacterium stellerae TaxID=2358193 RepID=UPI000F0BCFE7|nr:2'-5' RNA ligase family protein [Mycolicibacterium stellerae]
MVHSVELLFDTETDAEVRHLWAELTGAGVRSLASSTSPRNRPHVTLSVAEHMDDAVNDALRPLLRRLPLAATIGAPMLFGRGPFTLVCLVIPSADLLALQAEVHQVCLPHMSSTGPLPHAEPDHWTPHVTLARRVAKDKLADALSLRAMSRDRQGTVVGLRHWDGSNRVEYPIGR